MDDPETTPVTEDSEDGANEGRGAGRPRRDDWQEPFLEQLALHGIQAWAARATNVGLETIARERKRAPEFQERYAAAIEFSTATLERRAVQWAAAGIPTSKTVTKTFRDGTTEVTTTTDVELSATMLIFMLKARNRPVYGDSTRVESSGPEGGPIRIASLSALDAQIEALAAELAANDAPAEAVEADAGTDPPS